MAIYGWGNTAHGELGFGGIENEQILTPQKLDWKVSPYIRQIACGQRHTLFLAEDGKLYSCGVNDNGQLGHKLATKRPQNISSLDNDFIIQISCGAHHSVALTNWGQIFCWGRNNYGQLAQPPTTEMLMDPKIVKDLTAKHIIQVASGNNHVLVLSNCGELYAWGNNSYGQLGSENPIDIRSASEPTLIKSLFGIPVAFISCGGNHSFAVSKSGAVFGWGRNNVGQLGLNDTTNRFFPAQLKTMRTLGVRYIACGDEFSVFLTNDGGVFTCGSGVYGQLGHGTNSNEMVPRMVMELMGSTVTQVACGSRHTLTVVPSRGRVYGFGLGSSGQLGTRVTKNYSVPQVVLGPWVSPSGDALIKTHGTNSTDSLVIKKIYSGGEQSLMTTTHFAEEIPAEDCRRYKFPTQVLNLTRKNARDCANSRPGSTLEVDLFTEMETVFKSLACLNGSFLLQEDKHYCCTSKHHGVDLRQAKAAFDEIRKIENEILRSMIWDKITTELLPSLILSPADVETLRIYLILPLYHEFINSKNYMNLHTPFSNKVLGLLDIPKKIICKWWAEAPLDWFEHLVVVYKDVVAYIISFKMTSSTEDPALKLVSYNQHLVAALNMMVFLQHVNNSRKEKLHYESWNWDDLADHVDIQQNYIYWIFENNPEAFSLCNYPFLFNALTKTTLLQIDQALQMHNAMQNAANTGLMSLLSFGAPVSQFIVLNVSRENLMQDTLREIMRLNQSDLKKPLKIKFEDEEAEDAGGVRKEFFMLVLKDLLDPKYGMFREFEESRYLWFSDLTFESDDMYLLIGLICGLAIYNFTIINLPFPLALYKKLLHEPVDISDLRDVSPSIANSMQSLLDYEDDDFNEVFDLHFEMSREVYGAAVTVPLKVDGSNIRVTKENKEEFVDLYIDFIFNKSVGTQYKAFEQGFMKVCWGRVLQIFRPQELMAVIVGNEEYDWMLLELNCEYKNGYTAYDRTIKWFWEIFHELPLTEKKKFLLFLTGSDRIPVHGMSAIKIVIQPTNDERFLPVAHTCFNMLDLPRYKTKERLKFKLQQAIQQTQGFSLV